MVSLPWPTLIITTTFFHEGDRLLNLLLQERTTKSNYIYITLILSQISGIQIIIQIGN